MKIVYRDALGYVTVIVDESGIQFLNGTAFFSDEDGNDYMVEIENIVEIY
jgi:hypothetical protein